MKPLRLDEMAMPSKVPTQTLHMLRQVAKWKLERESTCECGKAQYRMNGLHCPNHRLEAAIRVAGEPGFTWIPAEKETEASA